VSQDFQNRQSIRIKSFDYASENRYFVTICVNGRACLFGKVVDDRVVLNEVGKMVEHTWRQLSERFSFVELDQFIVMPNHIHGILGLTRRNYG